MRHDEASTVVHPPSGAARLPLQQAIFTSVFSRVARGYRLVACSHGVRPDERKELLQLCPSHGSLLDEGAEAEGFASLVLRSGRRCILLTRHAGEEYSGRGGLRVHTHVLLLDAAEFIPFAHDPLRVAAAARRHIQPQWLDAPPAELDEITLHAPVASFRAVGQRLPLHATESRVLETLAGALLESRSTVLLDDPQPERHLTALLAALPAWRRASLTVSTGLRPAAARPVQLLVAKGNAAEIERLRAESAAMVIQWPRRESSALGEGVAESRSPALDSPRPSPATQTETPLRTTATGSTGMPPLRPRSLTSRGVLRTMPPPRPTPRHARSPHAPELGRTSPPDRIESKPRAPEGAPPARPADFAEWLDFCAIHWRRGDIASLYTISDAMTQPAPAPSLQRIIQITSALDEVASADAARMAQLREEFERDASCAGPHGELARRLLTAIDARIATGRIRANREDDPVERPTRGFYF